MPVKEMEAVDITLLVIRSLSQDWAKWANSAKCATSAPDAPSVRQGIHFTASSARKAALEIMLADTLDIAEADLMVQKVDKVLHKMRLRKPPRPGGKGPRVWEVTFAELEQWFRAHGLPPRGADANWDLPGDAPYPTREIGPLGTPGTPGTEERAGEPEREVFYLWPES